MNWHSTRRVFALALAALLAGGCETLETYMPATTRPFTVYKIDVNQGNYLSQDMVDKLKVDMTRTQVRTILGTASAGTRSRSPSSIGPPAKGR